MNAANPWNSANPLTIRSAAEIGVGFNIGFDERIPTDTQAELRRFVKWVEESFDIPVLLWVDFEYRHYLLSRERRRTGYLFYWAEFMPGEIISNKDDIPIIRLPVRTEHSTMDEILFSFIEAIGCYYIWLANGTLPCLPGDTHSEEILKAYRRAFPG